MLSRYWNHLWTEMSEVGRKTFPWDLARGASNGAITTLPMVFALLVAIQFFEASVLQKSFIAGAGAVGMLLSLPYASWSPVIRRKTIRGALPAFGAALGLIVAAFAQDASAYTFGVVIFGLFAAMPAPIMTAIYRDNYSGVVRGQVFGITLFTTVAIGLVVQLVGGHILDVQIEYFRYLFLMVALLSVIMGVAILQMPNKTGREPVTPNPFASFAVVWENPLFGYVLVAWFLFGFANMALMPQRIEYLSQPRYGLEFSPGTIVLVVGVTTEVARLCVIQAWAHLFDRFNFIWMRILLSFCMLMYVMLYYHTTSILVLVLASAFLGVSFGGGAIAWTLWVTKFAPPEETARYMAVHTFLTGVRGAIGPLIGYVCVEHLTIQITAWISAGLTMTSILMLWRIRNRTTRV